MEKEFKSRAKEYGYDVCITRADYEAMPIPMSASELSDEQMQAIADETAMELDSYNFDTESPDFKDDIEDAFWREMENAAVNRGMRYYEDFQ